MTSPSVARPEGARRVDLAVVGRGGAAATTAAGGVPEHALHRQERVLLDWLLGGSPAGERP